MSLKRTSSLSLRALRLAVLVPTMAVAMLLATVHPPAADASQNQVSIMQDDGMLLSNPAPTLLKMRQLGADVVRLAVRWQTIAPNPNSFKRPSHFNAANPGAYPAANWAPYDTIVRDAAADGLSVDFNVVGGSPLWATGPGMPKESKKKGYPFHNWEPSAAQYGLFVRALGTRYSGNYNPKTNTTAPGNSDDLPAVTVWSVWNEPDYGPSLAPQALPGHPGVEDSPRMYRMLVDAAWTALHQTGHGSNTIIFGELTPRNSTYSTTAFGVFNGMWPLQFLRALYCVNSSYKPLRGTAASLRGCPTTASGSAHFASQNPALFRASGVSDHPYQDGLAPNRELMPSPNGAGLTELGQLENALKRLVAVYGSHKVFQIWITEFGFITSPPKLPYPTAKDHDTYPSQASAAYYDNWSEYIAWKNPQVASFDQYLLQDPLPRLAANDYGGFASGLLNYNGTPKATFAAWRMPLYLPVTAANAGEPLEVWGAVKPVHFTALDIPYDNESVTVLFEPYGTSTFEPIATVPVAPPDGYFDTHVTFPASGTVELSWTYPSDPLLGMSGQTIYSRQVTITVN